MPEPIKFTDEQKKAYKAAYAANANAEQFGLFVSECERRALIPGVHVVFQLRKAEEYSQQLQRKVDVQKVTLISTINALRLIAERSGKFRGYGKFQWYYGNENDNGAPTIVSPIPLGKIPHAVSVELFREGWPLPVFSVARYDACVQTKADKTPTQMWYKRGEEQLAKCCEANGLRMVAPEECGGIYIEEEMQEQETVTQNEPRRGETITVGPYIPQPTVAPAVNQAPAEVTAPVVTFTSGENAGISAKVETAAPVVAHNLPEVAPKPVEVAHIAARPAAAPPKPPARPGPKAPVAVSAPVPVSEPKPTVKPADAPPSPAPNMHGVVVTDDDLPENLRGPSANESPKELTEFAARVARDTTGETAAALAVLAPANPTPATAQPASTAPVATTPKPQPTVAPSAAMGQTGEQPATQAEYQTFMGRASKIVRDKLEKEAKLKNAGNFMKDYLTKKSGKKLNHISAATFELLISELEKATPEQAAAIVKG